MFQLQQSSVPSGFGLVRNAKLLHVQMVRRLGCRQPLLMIYFVALRHHRRVLAASMFLVPAPTVLIHVLAFLLRRLNRR